MHVACSDATTATLKLAWPVTIPCQTSPARTSRSAPGSQRWELRSQQNNGGDEFYYAHKCRGDEKCIEKSINFFSIKYQVEWMFFQHCDDKSILWFAIHKECWMRLAEKSSLCLKSNNGNCGDNVMLGEAVTLLFSLLGFWQEPQNWFSQTEHSAARGPGVDLSST